MQILAQAIGSEVKIGEAYFMRLRNGSLWIELDHDEDDNFTYVNECSDPEYLEEQYKLALLAQTS